MRYLALNAFCPTLILALSLTGQGVPIKASWVVRPNSSVINGVKGEWECPNGFVLTGTYGVAGDAGTPPDCVNPASIPRKFKNLPYTMPKPTVPTGTAIRGNVVMPMTKQEAIRVKNGAIIWKKYFHRLPPNNFNPNRMRFSIENFTHPIRDGLHKPIPGNMPWDPRGPCVMIHGAKSCAPVVTPRYIFFLAPAGDHIFWAVG